MSVPEGEKMMGLLDWLKGPKSNVEEAGDLVWLNASAKSAGLVRSVSEALCSAESPMVVLVIAHFEDCLAEVRQSLKAGGIENPRVFAVHANDLASVKDALLGLDDSQLVEMIVAERHPLLEQDDALIQFARQCACRFRITHHLSLDDPLLQVFAGDWVRSVLERLGMKEDEAIQSRMVSRRVREAQKKITQNVVEKSVPESAEAWFERNVP